MMKLKKGFAIAMAAGVLTGAGLGTQVTALAGAAEPAPGAAETPTATVDKNLVTTTGNVKFGTLPDATQTGSLTIHKHDGTGEDAGSSQNGLLKTTKTNFGKPVPGAEFTIKKINDFDLTTNAGWQGLAKAVKGHEKDAQTVVASLNLQDLGAAGKKVTGSTGKVEFTGLALGAYYVEETKVPDNFVARTRPFIVTVPMTNPKVLNKWEYNLDIYAKNDPKQDQKTVKDSGAKIYGNKAEYTIATQLKTGEPTKVDPYDQFVITDFFPKERLEFVDASGTAVTDMTKIVAEDLVVSYGAEKTKGSSPAANTYSAGTSLVKTTETAADQGDWYLDSTTDLANGRVVIKLTAKGLEKLNVAGNNDKFVTVKLKFNVKEDKAGANAQFVNNFDVTTHRKNNPPKTPPTTPPENPPASPPSYYGNVDIVKKNVDGRMADAEFDLYACTANYTGDNVTGYTLDKSDATNFPKLGHFKADANADTAEIKGLLANDFQNGVAITKPTSAYCLVETKVPENYELLAQPVGFQVKKDEITSIIHTSDIINTKKNGGFELPLTGGKGVFALLLAGAAFLVLGRGYSVYAGRRKDA